MRIVVLITAVEKAQARKIAEALVGERLAACVNIIPDSVCSIFRWEGRVDEAQEVFLIVKTVRSKLSKIVKLVKKLHSYSVPEIIALPIVGGSADYLKWIDGSVRSGA